MSEKDIRGPVSIFLLTSLGTANNCKPMHANFRDGSSSNHRLNLTNGDGAAAAVKIRPEVSGAVVRSLYIDHDHREGTLVNQ